MSDEGSSEEDIFVDRCRFDARAVEPVRSRAEDATGPTNAGRELASTFAGVSHTCYETEGVVRTSDDAETVFERMRERRFDPPTYDSMTSRVPFTSNRSRGIVADASEAPNFCLLGG